MAGVIYVFFFFVFFTIHGRVGSRPHPKTYSTQIMTVCCSRRMCPWMIEIITTNKMGLGCMEITSFTDGWCGINIEWGGLEEEWRRKQVIYLQLRFPLWSVRIDEGGRSLCRGFAGSWQSQHLTIPLNPHIAYQRAACPIPSLSPDIKFCVRVG